MALSTTARNVLVLYAISLLSTLILFSGSSLDEGLEVALVFVIIIPLILAQLIMVAVSVQRAGDNAEWVWFWLIIAQGGALFYFWLIELGLMGDGEKW